MVSTTYLRSVCALAVHRSRPTVVTLGVGHERSRVVLFLLVDDGAVGRDEARVATLAADEVGLRRALDVDDSVARARTSARDALRTSTNGSTQDQGVGHAMCAPATHSRIQKARPSPWPQTRRCPSTAPRARRNRRRSRRRRHPRVARPDRTLALACRQSVPSFPSSQKCIRKWR